MEGLVHRRHTHTVLGTLCQLEKIPSRQLSHAELCWLDCSHTHSLLLAHLLKARSTAWHPSLLFPAPGQVLTNVISLQTVCTA